MMTTTAILPTHCPVCREAFTPDADQMARDEAERGVHDQCVAEQRAVEFVKWYTCQIEWSEYATEDERGLVTANLLGLITPLTALLRDVMSDRYPRCRHCGGWAYGPPGVSNDYATKCGAASHYRTETTTWLTTQNPPALGGCTCYDKAPTIPVFRGPNTHLDDCPAKDSGYAVGVFRGDGEGP
jgi:hypothetical protein